MKKNILKLFLLANFMFQASITLSEQSIQEDFINTQVTDPEHLSFQREALEQLQAEIRNQNNKIGSAIQRIIQAIQYDKIPCTNEQKLAVTKELKEFLYINQLLLKNLAQLNPEAMEEAIIYNTAMTKCLLKGLNSNILDLTTLQLADILEHVCHNCDPEGIHLLLIANNAKTEELLYKADSIGLTWYNKTYRYLTNMGAGATVKHLTYATAGIFTTYLIYKMINPSELNTQQTQAATFLKESLTDILKKQDTTLTAQSLNEEVHAIYSELLRAKNDHDIENTLKLYFDTQGVQDMMVKLAQPIEQPKQSMFQSAIQYIIGTPGKAILDQDGNPKVDPNNPHQLLVTTPTGLHKLGFLSGVATSYLFNKVIEDVKPYEKIKSIYSPWFNAAQYNTNKALTRLHEFLGGSAHKTLFLGEYENITFNDMTGADHLEEEAKIIANYMKYPERYEQSNIEIHRGILLYGPPQTGKTLFAKALRNLIQEVFGDDQKMHFIDVNAMMDINGWTVEYCFWYAQQNAPCILFFDEIDLTGGHREKSPVTTKQLFAGMQGIDSNKKVIVIGATNKPEQLDGALLKNGRFGKRIYVDYPKYQNRKKFLSAQIEKRGLNITNEYIDHVAQETEGCSYNDLKRIIDDAMVNSDLELQPVSEKHFEKALDTEIRKIQPTNLMSPTEKEIVATYQAGKALIRHLLETSNQVVKVTINNVDKNIKVQDMIAIKTDKDSDNDKISLHQKEQEFKYGEVFTKALTDNTNLLSDDQYEHECSALLAGGIALEIVLNKTFTKCNPQDRAEAMRIIKELVSKGEKVDEKVVEKALEIKTTYEHKIETLLKDHQELLTKIIQKLLDQNTIDRYEWAQLVS